MSARIRPVTETTDEQLDKLAETTPEDIDDAIAAWRRAAPMGFGGLITAKNKERPPRAPSRN